MLRLTLFTFVCAAFAATAVAQSDAPTPAGDAAVNLRPQFEEGRSTRYEFWTLRSTVNVTPRGEFTSEMQIDGQTTWTVSQVREDGSAVCEMTVQWVRATVTPPNGEPQTVDSREASGEPARLHQLVVALSGSPVRVEVAADGKVASASGYEAIVQAAGENSSLSERDFVEMATELAVLPGGPAEAMIGTTWNEQFQWGHDVGTLNYDTRFTFEGVERIGGIPIATVTSTASPTFDPDPEKMGDAPVTIRLVESSETERILFDLWRHEAVGRHQVLDLSFELTATTPAGQINMAMRERITSQVLRIAEE